MAEPESLVPVICPTCGGVLAFQPLTNSYDCAQGHQHTSAQLDAAIFHLIQRNLWAAIRQIQERETLLRMMAKRDLLAVPTQNPALALA